MTPIRTPLSSMDFSATNNVLEPHCKTYAIISRKLKGRGGAGFAPRYKGYNVVVNNTDEIPHLVFLLFLAKSFRGGGWGGGEKKFSFCTLLTTNNHFPIVGENKGGLRWGHFYCLLRGPGEGISIAERRGFVFAFGHSSVGLCSYVK